MLRFFTLNKQDSFKFSLYYQLEKYSIKSSDQKSMLSL